MADLVVCMPEISIIIPIYNEQAILHKEVLSIVSELKNFLPQINYEIILVENGSVDATRSIAEGLTRSYPTIRLVHLPAASYGRALKHGINESRGVYTVLFNIDFWDVPFIVKALEIMRYGKMDMVVGSKTMKGAEDTRPFLRRLITQLFNKLLRLIFGFTGTDTHGIKLLRQDKILPVVAACQTEREIFDTEFVLRSQRMGLLTAEIPVVCQEKRATVYHISKRIPRTIKDLIVLFFSLRR